MTGSSAPDFTNRTMWTRHSFDVQRGLNTESVDRLCGDRPFNRDKNYEAPIGSRTAGVAFKNTRTLNDIDIVSHGEITDRERQVYTVISRNAVCAVPANGECLRTNQRAGVSSL